MSGWSSPGSTPTARSEAMRRHAGWAHPQAATSRRSLPPSPYSPPPPAASPPSCRRSPPMPGLTLTVLPPAVCSRARHLDEEQARRRRAMPPPRAGRVPPARPPLASPGPLHPCTGPCRKGRPAPLHR
eukprot:1995768-Pleurochrysis_carterae.AAC.2